MSQKAYAVPAASYTQVPFTSAELQSSNWSTDRIAPSGGYISANVDGRTDVLSVGVKNPPTQTGFYQTEGVQRQIPASDTIKADLYVDGSWMNPHKDVRAGLWGVAKDSTNAISAYPIIEFTTTAAYTGWRTWDGVYGGWTNLASVKFNENYWNTVEISLNKVTHQFNLNINGTLVTSNAADTSTSIDAVIFNDYNYGTTTADDYTVNWSNFAYGNFDPVTPTVKTVTGNTSTTENSPGWMFNRDTSTATPFEFTTSQHSTGNGSLYVKPIGANPHDKMVAENFDKVAVADLNSISYDYRIDGNGDSSSAKQFYLNVYANKDASNKYYDCRFDYVPMTGSTTGFTNASFASTATPVNVAQSSSNLTACPATLAEMPAGSTVRMFSISVGDTSASDNGLAGYLDNVVVNKISGTTAYDFEPIVPDTTGPTITSPTVTNNALWGADYNILSKANHVSESTQLPVVGGTVQIGANFSDDRLLTNVIAYLPGLGFFDNSTITPNLTNSWTGIANGKYVVNWDTTNTTDWRHVSDGNYNFSFNARDGGNGQNGVQNYTYSTISLTVDNTGPTVGFVSPSPVEDALVSGTITIDGAFTDTNGLMNTDIGIHNDGRTGEGWKCHTDWPSQGTKNCQIDTTQLTDGTYKLTLAGRDKAGNVTQIFRTILVDNSAPKVVLSAPTGTIGGDNVDVMGYVNDANFRYYNCYFSTNQAITFLGQQFTTGQEPKASGNSLADPRCVTTWASSVTPTGTTPDNTSVKLGSFTIKDLPSGSYTIHVQGHDKAGNVNEANTTFTVDHTAPAAPAAAPIAGSYVGTQSVTLTNNASDLDGIYYTVDGSTPDKTSTLYTGAFEVSNTETVKAVAYDKAGNASLLFSAAYTIKPASTPLTVTNAPVTVANAGNIHGNGTANAGNARSAAVTANTPAVLGATDVKTDATGQVKGDSTTKKDVAIVAAKKSNAVFGLGWWWLAVLAAVIGFLLIVMRRSDGNKKA